MLNVIAIIVSKMTSHCVGNAQMREESEGGIMPLKCSKLFFRSHSRYHEPMRYNGQFG